MPTGNTTLLGLALPVEGELDGTWGDVVNDSITSLVDSAVAGTTTLSADADVTLTTTVLAANQARQAIILWTASNGATTRNITAPAQSKPYIVINAGTGSIVLRGAGPTTGITIVSGDKCLAAWNGSDFVKVASSVAGGLAYIFTTTPVTANNNQGVLTSTAGGAFTVTLPASPSVGNQVVVADAGASWGTNNLTVARNGSTIGGLAENLTCDITGASVQFVYDGTTWEVYAQIGGNGGTAVTLDGVQTLTNKTLVAPVLGTPSSGTLSSCTVDGTNAVGFRIIPQNSQSAAYTAVLADSGKQIFHPSADTTARTFTIPANSSVAYPIGTALSFINRTAQAW
jgi:hypothetical protein